MFNAKLRVKLTERQSGEITEFNKKVTKRINAKKEEDKLALSLKMKQLLDTPVELPEDMENSTFVINDCTFKI